MSDLSKEDWDVWAAIQLMARTPSFIELEERNEGEKTFRKSWRPSD